MEDSSNDLKNIKDEKVKNRIINLLSKTIANGCTKDEMEAALAMATKLMLENFISEHDLKKNSIVEECILLKVELIQIKYDLSGFYSSLARLFECKYYYNDTHVCFFGHREDTELCAYFYTLIMHGCIIAKKRYQFSRDFNIAKKEFNARTLVSSFMKGFILEVSDKMQLLYKDRESKIPPGYALMVIDKKKKVQEGFDKLNLKLSINTYNYIGYEVVYEQGRDKGKDFNLTQGLNDAQDAKIQAISD